MKNLLKKNLVLCLFAVCLPMAMQAADIITFTWKGSTDVKSFDISATNGKTFTVDWGNGTETFTGAGLMYTDCTQATAYGDEAEYMVTITAGEGCSLINLNVHIKEITSLNVSGATSLTGLFSITNRLGTLDISKNVQLKSLVCDNNQLGTLDISNNTQLDYLICSGNQLSALDVSRNMQLTDLSCGENQLTVLDISKNTQLTYLNCSDNQLSALDISENTELTFLWCTQNQLNDLDISSATLLNSLRCNDNPLSVLDVSKNTQLTYLSCYRLQLIALDVSKNTQLTNLNCSFNRINALDVSENTRLTDLDCSYNYQIKALDVSKNTQLNYLDCSYNQLIALDVSNNAQLASLYCSENRLSTLDVSNNTKLIYLDCRGNQIPLSDLYAISIQPGLRTKYLSHQNFPAQDIKKNEAFSLAGQMSLGGEQTKVAVNRGFNKPSVEGIDYQLDYVRETITFLVEGDFEVQLSNSAIVSNVYPAIMYMPFKVVSAADCDVEAVEISSPVSGSNMSNAETVTVTIRNNNSDPISNFDLTLKVNGKEIATETYTKDLYSLAYYTFTHTVDFSEIGDYFIEVSIALPGDINPDNNTCSKTVTNKMCYKITSFPWIEDFEEEPLCWKKETPVGNFVSWTWGTDSFWHLEGATFAYSEDMSMHLYSSYSGQTARLITPVMDLSNLRNPELNFWHVQQMRGDRQDRLRVYYKTSASGTWTLLKEYTENIGDWKEETLSLPNPTDDYYIAFEGTANYGYSIGLDDVEVRDATLKSITDAIVSAIGNRTYTGRAITPEPEVKDGETVLTKGTDYTLSYRNNVNVGTATITVTGIGSYEGKKTVNFTIDKALPTEPVFPSANPSSMVYDPEQALNTVSLTGGFGAGSFTWRYPDMIPTVDQADYELIFTPTDINNYDYSGLRGWDERSQTIIRSILLTVNPIEIEFTIIKEQTYTYTGLPVTIGAEVVMPSSSSRGVTPAIRFDYYHNGRLVDKAVNVGIYEAIVRSTDTNYKGEKTVNFTIDKAQPVILVDDVRTVYTGEPISVVYEIIGSYTVAELSRTLTFIGEDVNGASYGPTEEMPTEIGEYKVNISTPGNENHLPAEAEAVLKIVDGVSIDNIASGTFRIYPNPVSKNAMLIIDNGQLTIDNEMTFVEVYDTNGSLLRQIPLTGQTTEVSAEATEGIYLYVVKSDRGVMETVKVVVK